MKPTWYYFDRIHSWNAPLAFFLSLFGGQIAAREGSWPSWIPLKVEQLLFCEYDDWKRNFAQVFEKAKAQTSQTEEPSPWLVSHFGIEANLGEALFQEQLIRFQNFALTALLSLDHSKRLATSSGHFLGRPPKDPLLRNACATYLDEVAHSPILSRLNGILDFAEERFKSDIRLFLSTVIGLGRSLVGKKKPSRFKTVVRGVSAADFPISPGSTDFTWWTTYGGLLAEETLYVLPSTPGASTQTILGAAKIHWIVENQILTLLHPSKAFKTFFVGFLVTLRSLFSFSPLASQKYRLQMRTLLWLSVLKNCEVQQVIGSLGEAWPESPAIAAANALQIKTVNWSYAGSSFGYATHNPSFNDRTLWRSINLAREVWTWTPIHSDFIAERQLFRKTHTRFVSSGLTMSGNFNFLKMSAGAARRALPVARPNGFLLGVFDVPIYRPELTLRYGIWPNARLEAQEGLFAACLAIVKRFPEVTLLVKKKRAESGNFIIPSSFLKLTDPNSEWIKDGRVQILGSEVDPYLPICGSDACLAAPFTSPVMVSHLLGKPSYFYDATDSAKQTYRGYLLDLTVYHEEDLLRALEMDLERFKNLKDLDNQAVLNGEKLVNQIKSSLSSLRV